VDELWLSKRTSPQTTRVERRRASKSEGVPRSERETIEAALAETKARVPDLLERRQASNSTIYPRDPDQDLEHR